MNNETNQKTPTPVITGVHLVSRNVIENAQSTLPTLTANGPDARSIGTVERESVHVFEPSPLAETME